MYMYDQFDEKILQWGKIFEITTRIPVISTLHFYIFHTVRDCKTLVSPRPVMITKIPWNPFIFKQIITSKF